MNHGKVGKRSAHLADPVQFKRSRQDAVDPKIGKTYDLQPRAIGILGNVVPGPRRDSPGDEGRREKKKLFRSSQQFSELRIPWTAQ